MPGIDGIEVFSEIPKELNGNLIIDFPVSLEFNDHIILTPPDSLRNVLNGGITGLPILPRNIWDNVLYSKSDSGVDGKSKIKQPKNKEMVNDKYLNKKGIDAHELNCTLCQGHFSKIEYLIFRHA